MRYGLLITTLSLAFAGCVPQSPTVITDPAEVQRLARICIPPSATNLHCRTMCGIDRVTYGRFEIPLANLKSVLDRAPSDCEVKPYEGGYSNVTAHTMTEPWWKPDRLRDPRVAEWMEPGFSVNLMFGETDDVGMLTVYFFNFEM
jgi:hypothetical protein